MDFKKESELLLEQKTLPSIDWCLDSLSAEMKSLFIILDELSANIKKVEQSLQSQKAHFPFLWQVREENVRENHSTDLEKEIESIRLPYTGYYFIITRIYLAWEEDEVSRDYRLLLISEEIVVDNNNKIYSTKRLFSKPFIETNIKMRLEYAKNLSEFIIMFGWHLKKIRLSIEELNKDVSF